jgi:hypothetical protein
MPAAALAWIPALAMWFVVARMAFWIGYLIAPRFRAFGFAATVCPTAVVIAAVLIRLPAGQA